MTNSRELPSSLFEILPVLLPHLIKIFKKCQLSPTELFILSQIRHFGKEYKGQKIILGKDISAVLKELFHYSPSQASKVITKLADRGLIGWTYITGDEKEALFGDRKGKRWILTLLDDGSDKIDSMKTEINQLYREATSHIPNLILKPFSSALSPLTTEVAKSLREPRQ